MQQIIEKKKTNILPRNQLCTDSSLLTSIYYFEVPCGDDRLRLPRQTFDCPTLFLKPNPHKPPIRRRQYSRSARIASAILALCVFFLLVFPRPPDSVSFAPSAIDRISASVSASVSASHPALQALARARSNRKENEAKLADVHAKAKAAADASLQAAALAAHEKFSNTKSDELFSHPEKTQDSYKLRLSSDGDIIKTPDGIVKPPVVAPVPASIISTDTSAKQQPGNPGVPSLVMRDEEMAAIEQLVEADIPPHIRDDDYDQDRTVHELFLRLTSGQDKSTAAATPLRERYQSTVSAQKRPQNVKRALVDELKVSLEDDSVELEYLVYLEDMMVGTDLADDIEPVGVGQ
ncbi:hypothetical protein BZA70DRAFT_132680 [Myxozyma melibiosi]|uniref:Transmembrane protein n=1 Tax=Myxozyma melibiosi TaxID=54550 RepID=A0ABR1F921_9ASCO